MNKKITFCILLLISAITSFAQTCTFSGTLQDKDGNPIPYGSIYIPKLTSGNVANAEGNFQLQMPCGTYQIKVQSLGYENQVLTINVPQSKKDQVITLQPKSFQIKEVVINAAEEDPAYNIMRKTIAMATYYKKQIKEYDCNIYVRSFVLLDEIPGLIKLFADDEDLKDMKTGEISESLINYHYKYPNTTYTKVLSAKNGRNDTTNNGAEYLNLSFYQLGGSSIISPIDRNAFQVYKFVCT